ncbi:MAG TPA: HAD family hydrolase [Syntrophomonadaceae bacterium]|nr:HAD family hydrolase [Syntrophomonadaceae bacterium]HQA08353.1 HAD family hydrolase [Syntrophomonadaceae bacterium]HQE23810.1 HAD family hydrolase [Syntrophomonadaceae bacterium]
MLKYELVLFDLDGTLTDPWEGITKSVQYALAKMNIDEPDRHKLTAFIGPPLAESFQQFYHLSPEQAWLAVQYYREYFAEYGLYDNRVYPGIPELLQELNSRRIPLGIATSKPTVYTETILRHFDLADYFRLVVGSNMDGTRVAKADVIQACLAEFGRESRALMIGDRRHDIEGARSNGIDSVAVAYGYGSVEELTQARPNYLVHTVEELTQLLLDRPVLL